MRLAHGHKINALQLELKLEKRIAPRTDHEGAEAGLGTASQNTYNLVKAARTRWMLAASNRSQLKSLKEEQWMSYGRYDFYNILFHLYIKTRQGYMGTISVSNKIYCFWQH